MALPSRGAISFSDINAELGRSRTARINLGDASVRSLVGISAGAIRLSAGYGKASGGSFAGFIFTATISTNTANYNLKTAAIAAGWDQVLPLRATVTIDPGVYVYSVSTGSYAFNTGASFPAGTELYLINNGIILGMGGAGGTGGGWSPAGSIVAPSAGLAAGPALTAQYAISITNNGSIAGGGGGGGGGAASV